MSTGLAIAATSAVLVDLLNDGLATSDVPSGVGNIAVHALPPDRISASGNNIPNQLNLFLYQVTPNPAWRNMDMPVRNAAGDVVAEHALALDLHYLLSSYGTTDLHGEILLGLAMRILHDNPALGREVIRAALAPGSPVSGPAPVDLRLFDAGLADQFEQIRITPVTMTTEDLSRLWAAFQSNYRPTVAYVASVVLIESRRTPRTALPVHSRGLRVLPLEQPVITRIRTVDAAASPPVSDNGLIFADSTLIIEGQQLSGELTRVVVAGQEVVPSFIEEEQLRTGLPAAITAGVHGLQVVHQLELGSPPVPHRGVESNVEAIVVRPRIAAPVQVANATVNGGLIDADVEVTLDPAIGDRQRVVLLLNELGVAPGQTPRAYRFAPPDRGPAGPATLARIPIQRVPAGSYLLRVQVDGAESPVARGASGVLDSPQVTLP